MVGITVVLTAMVGCSKETTPNEVGEGYKLRTLSFEGEAWNALIDEVQYNGALLYTEGDIYEWHDGDNTELYHTFTAPYWNGGHAISNFVVADYATLPEGYQGWYELQLSTPNGGHNDSQNFAIHNGYSDDINQKAAPTIAFKDNIERVIDHMWVMNTSYMLNTLCYGDGFSGPATETTTLSIVAIGYNSEGAEIGSTTFTLCNKGKVITEWTKWDLSVLGKVAKLAFNLDASSDLIGEWGLSCPAYFAYDDVAVRFEE